MYDERLERPVLLHSLAIDLEGQPLRRPEPGLVPPRLPPPRIPSSKTSFGSPRRRRWLISDHASTKGLLLAILLYLVCCLIAAIVRWKLT